METRIRARLTHINANLRNPEENGGARLQEVFDEVECVDPNSEDRLSAALFVLLAETAVRVNNSTIATECLRLYYSVHPPKDQFQIRALCCRAQLEAKLAAGLKGEPLVAQLKIAISFLLSALTACEETPSTFTRYGFLVYNISVFYWYVCRPLLRESARTPLLDSMTRVVTALEKACQSNATILEVDSEWLGQLYCALALVQDECGQSDAAAATVTKAVKMITPTNPAKLSLAFKERVLRYQIQLNRANRKNVDVVIAEQDKAEWFPGAKTLAVIQLIRSVLLGTAPADQIEAQLATAWKQVENLDTKTTAAAALADAVAGKTSEEAALGGNGIGAGGDAWMVWDVIGELSRVALMQQNSQLARDAAQKALQSRTVGLRRGWLLAELTLAELKVQTADRADIGQPTSAKMALIRRTELLRSLEQVLDSCVRLEDASCIEDACSTIWNIVLPLLQRRFRPLIHSLLQKCAQALERIDSNLNVLRVSLHTEVSKCELLADFVDKAAKQVNVALSIDYTIPVRALPAEVQNSEQLEFFQRPMDRFLLPMQAAFATKANMYGEPDGAEDKAFLLIEQSKEAPDAAMKRTLLQRAIQAMDSTDGKITAAPGDEKMKVEEREKSHRVRQNLLDKRRCSLWFDVMTVAWAARLSDLARAGVKHVLELQWEPTLGTEQLLLQARAQLTLAEIEADALANADLPAGEKLSASLFLDPDTMHSSLASRQQPANVADPAAAEEARLFALLSEQQKSELETARARQQALIDALMAACEIGVKLKEDWLAKTAVTYLWNYHLPLFKDAAYAQMIPALCNALKRALQVILAQEGRDLALACSLTEAISLYLEEQKQYDAAMESIRPMLPLLPAWQKRELVRCYARSHRLSQKDKDAAGAGEEREVKALVALQVFFLESTPADQKKKCFSTALDTLSRAPPQSGFGQAPAAAAPAAKGAAPAAAPVVPFNPNEKPPLDEAVNEGRAGWASALRETETQLECELWTLLSSAASIQGEAMAAIDAARHVLLSLPEPTANGDSHQNIPAKRWRWYSLAQCVCGRAYAALIDPDTQDKRAQDQIRAQAVSLFAQSATFGHRAEDGELALDAARQLWNCGLPFMNTALTRQVLRPHLGTALTALEKSLPEALPELDDDDEGSSNKLALTRVVTELAPEFRVELYRLFFESLSDAKAFEEGMEASARALDCLPPAQHRGVWEHRILFMSALGQDVAAGVAKAKGKDASMQGRLWVSLARASKQPLAQFRAFQKAVAVYARPLDQVEPMLDLAQWLLVQRLASDAEDLLLGAADILMDLEAVDEEDEEGGDGKGDQRSMTSKGSSAKRSTALTSQKGSSRGSSRKTSSVARSSVGSRRSSRSGRSGASSARSNIEKEEEVEEIDETQSGQLNVRRLATLVRIYGMMAQCASSVEERDSHIALAQHFVVRMWLTTMATVNRLDSEDAHKAALAAAPPAPPAPADPKSKGKDAIPPVPPPAPLLNRYPAPQTEMDWVQFSLSVPLIDLMKRGRNSQTMLASNTLPDPQLFYHELLSISDALEEADKVMDSLPVSLLIELLCSESVLQMRALRSLTLLRRARSLARLELLVEARAALQAAEPLLPTDAEARVFRDTVEQREQLSSDQNSSSAPTSSSERSAEIFIRQTWAHMAAVLVESGKISLAKRFLVDAQRHAQAFEDREVLAHVMVIRARIAKLEGDPVTAMDLTSRAMSTFNGDAAWWVARLSDQTSLMLYSLSQRADALNVLRAAAGILSTRAANDRSLIARRAVPAVNCLWASALCSPGGNEREAREGLALFERATQQAKDLHDSVAAAKALEARVAVELSRVLAQMQSAEGPVNKAAEAAGAGWTMRRVALEQSQRLLSEAYSLRQVLLRSSRAPMLGSPAQKISTPASRALRSTACQLAECTLLLEMETLRQPQLSAYQEATARTQSGRVTGGGSMAFATMPGRDGTVVLEYLYQLQEEITKPEMPVVRASPFDAAVALASTAANLDTAPTSLGTLGRALWCSFVAQTRVSGVPIDVWRAGITPLSKIVATAPLALPSPALELSLLPASLVQLASTATQRLNASLTAALTQTPPSGGAASLGSLDCISRAAFDLAFAWGSLTPFETARALALAQSAALSSYGRSIFMAAARADNSERMLCALSESIRADLSPNVPSPELDKVEAFLLASSPAFRALRLEPFSAAGGFGVAAAAPAAPAASPPDAAWWSSVGSPPSWSAYMPLEDIVSGAWGPGWSDITVVSFFLPPPPAHGVYAFAFAAGRMESVCVARLELDPENEREWLRMIARAQQLLTVRVPKRVLANSQAGAAGLTAAALADEQMLSSEFDGIVAQLSERMQPILSQFSADLFQNRDVVLLVDSPQMGRLPFEALPAFASARSVSRDFSLPMLLRRAQAQKTKAPIKRGSVAFVADHRKEDVTASGSATCDMLNALKAKVAGSAEWKGVLGTERVPVAGEVQRLIVGAQAFVFAGFGRFTSLFDVGLTAALPCSTVSLMHLADQSLNMSSFRRQNKTDNSKTEARRALEQPHALALLISLRGVDAVIMNQHSCAAPVNRERTDLLWSALSKGTPCGAAVHALRTQIPQAKSYEAFNAVVFGLPAVAMADK